MGTSTCKKFTIYPLHANFLPFDNLFDESQRVNPKYLLGLPELVSAQLLIADHAPLGDLIPFCILFRINSAHSVSQPLVSGYLGLPAFPNNLINLFPAHEGGLPPVVGGVALLLFRFHFVLDEAFDVILEKPPLNVIFLSFLGIR